MNSLLGAVLTMWTSHVYFHFTAKGQCLWKTMFLPMFSTAENAHLVTFSAGNYCFHSNWSVHTVCPILFIPDRTCWQHWVKWCVLCQPVCAKTYLNVVYTANLLHINGKSMKNTCPQNAKTILSMMEFFLRCMYTSWNFEVSLIFTNSEYEVTARLYPRHLCVIITGMQHNQNPRKTQSIMIPKQPWLNTNWLSPARLKICVCQRSRQSAGSQQQQQQAVTPALLTRVWPEPEHRLHTCRAVNGAHIKLVQCYKLDSFVKPDVLHDSVLLSALFSVFSGLCVNKHYAPQVLFQWHPAFL
jgi:hypothetical protein